MKCSHFNIITEYDERIIIMNTMSGAIAEIDDATRNALRSNRLDLLDNVDEFIHEGFLVEDNLNEIDLLRSIYRFSQSSKYEICLIIALTTKCNFACPYCFERKQGNDILPKVVKALPKFLEDQIRSETQQISIGWFGGEPLLRSDILMLLEKKFREIARKRGIDYHSSITTNGYLLNKTLLQSFRNLGIDSLKITIDGKEDVHNSKRHLVDGSPTFKTICTNIMMASTLGFQILVRVNIDRTNLKAFEDVKEMFRASERIACYPAIISPEDSQSAQQRHQCLPINEHKAFYESHSPFFTKWSLDKMLYPGVKSCMAEKENSFIIDPNGYLYKCVSDLENKEFAVGNIFSSFSPSPAAIAKYYGRDPFTEKECRSCKLLPVCYGSCVDIYSRTGFHACCPMKYNMHDIICSLLREEDVCYE